MQTPISNPDWLTKKQAAAILQVSLRTIDRYMESGTILSKKLGVRSVRISMNSIDKLLRN
jgi:excisionase family DNA binding protein